MNIARTWSRVAVVPVAVLLIAADGYDVTPSTNKILWAADTLFPASEIVVKRGEVFYQRPVGKEMSAVLGGDLTLTIADKSMTMVKGTQLIVARAVGGVAAKQLADRAHVFCSDQKSDAGKAIANFMTLGLTSNTHRTGVATQFCLVDSDGDGKVDMAFLVGAKNAADLAPIPVTPTSVAVARDVPLPGDSVARLRFDGAVGLFGKIAFDLEIVESGKSLTFGNGRTVIAKDKLPTDVHIFGAWFTVLAYDPVTGDVRLRWNGGFTSAPYGVTTTTTYIPMYFHR